MAGLLDGVVTAGDAGAEKPGLAPFLMAATACGCAPREIVHIGDSVKSDTDRWTDRRMDASTH